MEEASTKRNGLDPSADRMREVGYRMIDRFVEHLDSLPDQKVVQLASHEQYQESFGQALPLSPTDPLECLEFFFDKIVPGMTRVNHPRFHAFIPCPSSFAGALGMMMSCSTNPFVGSWLGGASIASLELMVLDWIKELLGLEPSYSGILTSGGSIANLIGLAAARARNSNEILSTGVIYVSEQGHASVDKAASVLGFDPENLRHIRTDENFRLDTAALQEAIVNDREKGLQPFLVSANAGSTNTGSIDELAAVSKLCQQNELWFHVDAAYGGFAAIAPDVRNKMRGIELADSITLDPHKWLYCPMGVGCAFVRKRQDLESAFAAHGSYLKDLDPDEVNFLDRGPELSRPARVLPVWMVLKCAGRDGLKEQIGNDIELANLAARLLAEDERIEVVSLNLSIVTFRLRSNAGESEQARSARESKLVNDLLADGEAMISSTTLGGRSTLRFVVMNHRTTEQDVRRSIRKICEFASV